MESQEIRGVEGRMELYTVAGVNCLRAKSC